jgi:hypothetical protein
MLPGRAMTDEENYRPFIEDGSQFGMSRETFEQMDEEEQREAMVEWFHQNFEDPANSTPWDGENKEYMYLWGGPYDANEQLSDKFGNIVSDELIETVAKEIENDGIVDWAPRSSSPFYERDEEERPEPPTLDIYSDVPSEDYGSAWEREARARAKAALEDLRKALDSVPAGIGHNRPPDEEAVEPEEIKEVPVAVQQLSAELDKSNPSIALVKKWAQPLRDALVAIGVWGWKKLDKGLDTAVILGIGWAFAHPDQLRTAYDAIISWLDVAAKLVH